MVDGKSENGDPISEWVRRLADGDSKAQRSIWQAYERRLKNCAKNHFVGANGLSADEDDVAGMVMASLFRRMDEGRMSPPEDRQKFWALLRTMTKNKSVEVLRRENAIKRGAGTVASGSQVGSVPGSDFEPHRLMEQAERFV
ncbi:MAG: ECF-type sigma factor, partial [Planctomycetota bacterium]